MFYVFKHLFTFLIFCYNGVNPGFTYCLPKFRDRQAHIHFTWMGILVKTVSTVFITPFTKLSKMNGKTQNKEESSSAFELVNYSNSIM